MKQAIIILASLTISSCATMFSGETQQIQVNTTANNSITQNVNCTIQNGRGTWNITSSSVATIRRDGNPLIISCGNADKSLIGTTSIAPFYNTTNLWNIPLTLFFIVPGVVGWVWDGVDGTTNEYPKTINVALSSNHEAESKVVESEPLLKTNSTK